VNHILVNASNDRLKIDLRAPRIIIFKGHAGENRRPARFMRDFQPLKVWVGLKPRCYNCEPEQAFAELQ
jgi:hypothetical protein